jgi:hypothetical protein
MISKAIRFVGVGLGGLACLIAIAWAAGAIYFDLPIAWLRMPLALAFALGMLAALIFTKGRWRASGRVGLGFALVLGWWLTIQPPSAGQWQADVAQEPFAQIEGDNVVIHNFRNFDYRTETDYDERWETKGLHLSNLRGVDFFMSYWGSPLICHTLLSFDFGPEGFVCASMETRKRKGQSYSAIRGFYRQFPLCYVIADERDLIRLRTNYRREDVYLYHLIPATPEKARELFLDYVRGANKLHDQPQWYNAVTSNCTTNIRLHIKNIGSARPWDWQIIANGYIDERAYALGAIDTAMPFEKLKSLSYITKRAQVIDGDPAYSLLIREGLPGMAPIRPE